jgi:uncharacterized protein
MVLKIPSNRVEFCVNMNPFSLLIKPTSADCNLNCSYCFYLDKSKIYPESTKHRMSDTVLEQMVATYMATDQPTFYFGWQGGEPTLMGFDFFRHAVALQKKYGRWGATVSNGLQTNATLITDDMAALFAEYHFLVGVSIDGPADVHDHNRKTTSGSGSHARVLEGISRLERHGVEYNALVLINSENVHRPQDIYNYLMDLGIHHHQYIPCVEFDGRGALRPFAVTGKQWGDFLCGIFDAWVPKDTQRVSIRNFDAILGQMIQGQYTVCHQAGHCTQYFVVEYNGDVYPCDFFVDPHRKLGNIAEHSWTELQTSRKYKAFGDQKADWHQDCTVCEFLRYCSGDCIKYRFHKNKNPKNKSWLCPGVKRFLRHSMPRFEKISLAYLNEQQTGAPGANKPILTELPKPHPRRSDPCFCGSGKKYRDCHGVGGRKKKKF